MWLYFSSDYDVNLYTGLERAALVARAEQQRSFERNQSDESIGGLAPPVQGQGELLAPVLKSQHGSVIKSIIKCGIELLTHSQTSTAAPLKFGNG